MSSPYRIERISREKLGDLIPLYRNVFGKNAGVDYFLKKFDTKIFGAEYTGFIAYSSSGEPAAYYGLFPCIVQYGDQKIISATSGDTMTHSAHRGKGLFTMLAERTYELAKRSGIKFAYGFPNQDSLKGSVNLGWKYPGDHLHLYTFKVSTIPVSKIARKINLQDVLYPKRDLTSGFPNSLEGSEHGFVRHDGDYFHYKSYTAKNITRVAGCHVWMKVDGALKIGDIEKKNFFDIKYFLEELKKFAAWRGINEIQFMTSDNTWLDKELSACMEGKAVFPVGHFDFDAGDMDFRKIKYMMSDLDTF